METKTSLNRYCESTLTVNQTIDLLLEGKSIDSIIIDNKYERGLFNTQVEQVVNTECHINSPTNDVSLDEYHSRNINTWFIPDKYKKLDVYAYLISLCNEQTEIDRVNLEYTMYKERKLVNVLRFFIYLIDHLRNNKIIWGVGRGSSVASYILFLIGTHKIDSLKFNLDITEFLK